ncbi:MAG: glycerate kinase [Thermoproteota archaeon]|nr:glycerate kinase [Thermoproteota archaeon]
MIDYLIINRQKLERFHNSKSSKLILSTLEAAIDSVRPASLIKHAIKFSNSKLTVRDIHGNVSKLGEFDRVYVVGAGKATFGMAYAVCSVLDDKIAAGAITVPYGTKAKEIKRVLVTEASHPIPDNAGIRGTRNILSILRTADQNDLVIFLISGGGSALMPMPASGITLADKQKTTNLLLRSGASIQEINTVRKHLSAVKGGQLLRHVNQSCLLLSLVLSDVIGDNLGMIASGPTYPDSSTFTDALNILRKYYIKGPAAVIHYIDKGAKGEIEETPKPQDRLFSRIHNVLIGNNAIACKAAVSYLKKRGIQAVNLGSEFDGEAKEFGMFLARRASGLGSKRHAIVAGGETTVKLGRSKNGLGGRNQETALSFLAGLDRADVAIGCMGTDGIDGNSDAAGALVSPKTIMLAEKVDLDKYLNTHDSYHAFEKLNSLIFTGFTGTNVNDIAIICPELK